MIHILRTLFWHSLEQNEQMCKAGHHDWLHVNTGKRILSPDALCACSCCGKHYASFLSATKRRFLYPSRKGYIIGRNEANGEVIKAHLHWVNHDTALAKGSYFVNGRYGPVTTIPLYYITQWFYVEDFYTLEGSDIQIKENSLKLGV